MNDIEENAKRFRCLCGSSDTFTECRTCGLRWYMPGQMQASISHKKTFQFTPEEVELIHLMAKSHSDPEKHDLWERIAKKMKNTMPP